MEALEGNCMVCSKKRYYKHKATFEDPEHPQHTTLSSYIWKLKNDNIPWDIKWSVKARGHPFSSGSDTCDLCITEKLTILIIEWNNYN